MDARKEVRRAERDAWNRLNSIVEDADWVAGFHQSHAPHLPLLANLRCGAWYVPTACDKGCYFKSTDGHTGQWDFSLKRHNLDLLYTIQRQGGCVIVDSTRRGKSMPDALSKTVPIWCFVMNAASYQRHGLPASTPMQLPPHIVSPSESSQIEARTDRWVQALLSSDLPVPRLEKPLRPLYVTRSHQDKEAQHMGKTDALAYYPVVLISASQMVPTPGLEPLHSTTRASSLNLPRDTEVLRRQSRFIYVQGSGDDEEMWSFKLTPALFWEPAHLRAILGAGGGGEALETVLQRTVKESKQGSVTQNVSGDVELGDFNLFLGTRQRNHSFSSGERLRYRLIVQADGEGTIADGKDREKPEQCQVLQLGISPGKRGLAAFRGAIPTVVVSALLEGSPAASQPSPLPCSKRPTKRFPVRFSYAVQRAAPATTS